MSNFKANIMENCNTTPVYNKSRCFVILYTLQNLRIFKKNQISLLVMKARKNNNVRCMKGLIW